MPEHATLVTPPAIILAAGRGTRLGPLTAHRPKALVELAGKPLIFHVLEGLAQAGIRRAIVVTGYRHQQLEAVLACLSSAEMEVVPVFNADYERGNGDSLLAAKPFAARRFLLAMADHLAELEIYRRAARASGSALAVDYRPTLHSQLDDATRVWVQDGSVRRIGKNLTEWNGIDTGVFSLTPTIFAALEFLGRQRTLSLTDGISRWISTGGRLQALDVSGLCWSDVDTPDDLREAADLCPVPSSRRRGVPKAG